MLLVSTRGTAIEQAIGDGEIAAPDLLNAEVVNALRRMEAARLLDAKRAAAAIDRLADAPVQRLTTAHLVRAIWTLRHNLTPYDATYVALAQELECPLVTADARLTRVPKLTIEIAAP